METTMPLTVRLEDDVVRALQRYATPFVDDVNTTIRKLLRMVEGGAAVEAEVEQGRTLTRETPIAGIRRRERTLHVLLREGILRSGTELAFARQKLHGSLPMSPDDSKLRCKVGPQPRARENVIWEHDGKSYSLSGLTEMLRDKYAMPLSAGALNGYDSWTLVSNPQETLWEIAESRGRA